MDELDFVLLCIKIKAAEMGKETARRSRNLNRIIQFNLIDLI